MRATRWTVWAERVEYLRLLGTLADGRIVIGRDWVAWTAPRVGTGRKYAARFGAPATTPAGKWAWESEAGPTPRSFFRFEDRWHWYGRDGWLSRADYRSTPCWLLALLAGAWPLASAVLLVRRRRRAQRLRLTGCCRRCGYDLRATPAAGGPRLATCPECGAGGAKRQKDEG